MNPERRVITIPGKKEHSGILLAHAMIDAGLDIKISDSFEIIGDKKTQGVFFGFLTPPK